MYANSIRTLLKFQQIRCLAIAALLTCLVSIPALAQHAPHSDHRQSNELDVWTGSSLGIRIDFDSEQPKIKNIYDHVAPSSPFSEGDILLSLGSLEFPGSTVEELGELLDRSQPGDELKAVVKRGEGQLQLNVTTFRKELVDIAPIYRRLSQNRIIEKYLQETNRPGLIEDLKERMAIAVRSSESPRRAAEAVNRIIDEIGVSHTAIIPASAGLGFSTKPKGSLGLVLQRHTINNRTGYFVVDRKPGTVGYGSNILLGDEILTVNGVEIEKSRRLQLSGHEDRHQLFVIAADIDESCDIEYLRTPFDDSQLVRLISSTDPSTVASVTASKTQLQAYGKKIGYLRFWNLMSMGVNGVFKKAASSEFADCDAIVMDLRGRGGIVPAVLALNRSAGSIEKPVIVTIDGLTRSAKEMLAYLLKKQSNVLVVGQTTAGAVTGATIAKLPSGNSLMFPVASADMLKQFIDGEVLEGVGVEPDEFVEHFVPYCAGQDRILNLAVKRAVELVDAKKNMANTIESAGTSGR